MTQYDHQIQTSAIIFVLQFVANDNYFLALSGLNLIMHVGCKIAMRYVDSKVSLETFYESFLIKYVIIGKLEGSLLARDHELFPG